MKPVLIDASSAILLYKADLLEQMASAFALCMLPSVVREVTVADRQGAVWFLNAFAGRKLNPLPADGNPDNHLDLSGLGAGERETLMAYSRKKVRFIIIDDKKGARICRRAMIPFINALLCPKILFWNGWIDRRAFCKSFEYLLAAGRYSRSVADYARNCSAAELHSFFPAVA